jgi:hypothetical protein
VGFYLVLLLGSIGHRSDVMIDSGLKSAFDLSLHDGRSQTNFALQQVSLHIFTSISTLLKENSHLVKLKENQKSCVRSTAGCGGSHLQHNKDRLTGREDSILW